MISVPGSSSMCKGIERIELHIKYIKYIVSMLELYMLKQAAREPVFPSLVLK